jgi:hypothetical protein
MKKLLLVALMATIGATAQTLIPSNIVKATNGSLLLQGTNSAGTPTQSVEVTNVGHIFARSANFNGSDGVSAQKLTLSNGGAITGSDQVVTIDAVGNGNVVIKDQTTIEGNLRVNQTISSSQAIQTTGTGSIHSAYNLSAAGNKFNVAGDSGLITSNGINNNLKGITNAGLITQVTAGNVNETSLQAINGSQLHATNTIVSNNATIAANAISQVQSNLNSTDLNVANNTNDILDLRSVKADKTQVLNDIAAAKEQAITSSNLYTDGKINALDNKFTSEVSKLNVEILDINENLSKVNSKVNVQVERLDNRIDETNENVRENTINITNLQNSKADKFQVELDIAQAKSEAITTSNAYTDTKVGALETKVNTQVTRLDGRIDNLDSKVNTEVSRLDGRIDATNQNVTNLSNKVTTEVARVDSRIDATNTTVEANKKEAADATAKVQSNLDKEAKRLDMKIDSEVQKVESKFNQKITEVDLRLNNRIDAVMTYVGNEFKAVNNRIEGLGASMVALSAAATSSVYNANKPTNLNIGTGFYGRSTAIAVGMSHFFNASTKVSVNWSQGSHTKNAVGIGAGFAF